MKSSSLGDLVRLQRRSTALTEGIGDATVAIAELFVRHHGLDGRHQVGLEQLKSVRLTVCNVVARNSNEVNVRGVSAGRVKKVSTQGPGS